MQIKANTTDFIAKVKYQKLLKGLKTYTTIFNSVMMLQNKNENGKTERKKKHCHI